MGGPRRALQAGFSALEPERDLGLDLDSSPDPDGLVPRTSERLHSGPHVAPQLEALIPTSLWQDGAEIDSQTASQWASGLLDRALQRLSVRPRDVVVVCGMGLREAGLIVNVYRVPGVDEVALDREFRIVITRPHRGSTWQRRMVGGREVWWSAPPANSPDHDPGFHVAFWVADACVVHVAGDEDRIEAAIPMLP